MLIFFVSPKAGMSSFEELDALVIYLAMHLMVIYHSTRKKKPRHYIFNRSVNIIEKTVIFLQKMNNTFFPLFKKRRRDDKDLD